MSILTTLKKNWTTIAGVVVALAVVVGFVKTRGGDEAPTYTVSSDRLVSEGVSVAGTVVPNQDVKLGFETTGRVTAVFAAEGARVGQGQVIARLDSSELSADLDKANADLAAEVAKLEELRASEGGLTQLDTARQKIVQEIRSSLTVVDDAIRIKVDQFFIDRDTAYPKIVFLFDDAKLRTQINTDRKDLERMLKNWAEQVRGMDPNNYTPEMLATAKTNLTTVKTFLADIVYAVSDFKPEGSYTQATIDSYRMDASAARSAVDAAFANLLATEESFRGTVSQVPYQEARVAAARATVRNLQARIAKTQITAPFSGTVVVNDAKVGSIAGANQTLVTLQSSSKFEVETFIPEVFIAGIEVGAPATVTFDAYGEGEEFTASVSFVDSASTETDGVATYKVKLVFEAADERIKSGLTANATISTTVGPKAARVPVEAIEDRDGIKYVRVQAGEAVELRLVQVSDEPATDGMVSVTAGIAVGDVLVLPMLTDK